MNRLMVLTMTMAAGLSGQTPGLKGLWDAKVTVEGQGVEFRMEFERGRAAFLDGERRIWSSGLKAVGDEVTIEWNYFDSTLKAKLAGGRLVGEYSRRTRAGSVKRAFEAAPFRAPGVAAETPAQFAGVWRIESDAKRGTRAMEGVFRQAGAVVTGTIQRVDGDFGVLEGRVSGKTLVLSHFDGIRATRIEARMEADGTLTGTLGPGVNFRAAKAERAAALGLMEPPDPTRYIAVKDPTEAFRFAFEDLDGKTVSLEDAKFQGKAVMVTITGSWCPNCHDEAPFLKELYAKYRGQGFEVVSLFFEYTGEAERDREQVRRFVKLHGANWTFLLAGSTEDGEVLRKLPQIANFAVFPTTLFLDRSHKVAAIHAGFAGPANVAEHAKLKKETEELVAGLLKR